jgi:two-component system chemotaxis response regulator CheB
MIIVIGASAGGVEALRSVFRSLDSGINAAIFVVLHILPESESYLPQILSRYGRIPVQHAEDGEKIKPGRAYIAPPDRHLILQDGRMRLTFGPRVNHTRPAIDPLFESAANQYGPDVTGVILSGLLHDGAKGLLTIKQAGGIAIVQKPEDALFGSMPDSALQNTEVDYILPARNISAVLNKLSSELVLEKGETRVKEQLPDFSQDEVELIREEVRSFAEGQTPNQRSVLTCPDCGGVLWELKDGQLVRYRCHTGHVYEAASLLSSYDRDFEKAFWTAIRVMVEKAAISNRLAIHAKANGDNEREAFYLSQAKEAEKEAVRVRESWFNGQAKNSKSESAGEQANEELTRSAD